MGVLKSNFPLVIDVVVIVCEILGVFSTLLDFFVVWEGRPRERLEGVFSSDRKSSSVLVATVPSRVLCGVTS